MNVLGTVGQLVAAQADVLDPEKVATGLSKNPLAWGCVILLGAVIFLGRALLASYEKRIEALTVYQEQTNATLTSVVTLGLKTTEALDVVDRVIERYTPSKEG
jgi:hypothetical protein